MDHSLTVYRLVILAAGLGIRGSYPGVRPQPCLMKSHAVISRHLNDAYASGRTGAGGFYLLKNIFDFRLRSH